MIDKLGRTIDQLRISLTNRCNLDCFYCHREGNRDTCEEMGLDRIRFMLEEARAAGIRAIKFTGGEPLLRDDIVDIIEAAAALGFEDIGLTTNGTLLESKARALNAAGLDRVNIGCDTLTGCLPKSTTRLLQGILAARKAGLAVKLNMVVLKNVNEHEVPDMLAFCRKHRINLQLIELVDNDHDTYRRYHSSLDEISLMLERTAGAVIVRDMQRRKRYMFGGMFVEVVQPNREFCARCNKVRITADGRLRQCLMKQAQAIDFIDRRSIEFACTTRDSYGYA